MPTHSRAQLALKVTVLCFLSAPSPTHGQGQPSPSAKKPPVGPAAPESTHYPILLLAFGNDPNWNLRIGPKGPERLDRPGYPPIPLDPAEVTHEAAADSWTYHAKDSATGAVLAVHLTREVCAEAVNDPTAAARPSSGKYPFRVAVDHTQLGSMKGCARIAAELFPKINNQADADDTDKKKAPAPTITNFKPPLSLAYASPARKIVFKLGAVSRVISTESDQLAISHDGNRLLYTREDQGGNRAILLYDFATEKSREFLSGSVQHPFWSPDDTRVAFMKLVDGKWNLWVAQVASPENAFSVYSAGNLSIHGWADAHTILVDDLVEHLYWVRDDGIIGQTLSLKDVYGDSFKVSSHNSVRLHPLNSDLLLVATESLKPSPGVSVDQRSGGGSGFFLFEIRSKRRVNLGPQNMVAQFAEWSRDGLQIFFTGTDSLQHSATYRLFWDGTGLQKYSSGTHLVIGQ